MVVYLLIVAKTKQGHHAQKEAATRVLNAIRRKHRSIVTQSEMFARELVRLAVLWGELWYEKLEEASRLYSGEKDLDAMLHCILPIHETISRGLETSYEKAFMDLHGREPIQTDEIVRDVANAKKQNASVADLEQKTSKLWEYY